MLMSQPGVAAIALSLWVSAGAAQPSFGQERVAGSILVRSANGEVTLSPSDLQKVARHEQRVDVEGTTDPLTVSGVFLWDLLQLARVPSPNASGRQRAVMYIKLTGADGQRAVLALVEVDPGFSKRIVIVADRSNGQPLDDAEGPWRVFIPDDLRHARWIRGLVSIEIVTIK